MKKQYLLALMASVVCGMSAQAQTVTHQAAAKNDLQAEKANAGQVITPTSSSLLRSTTTILCDSVVRTDGTGTKMNKYVYEYNEKGQQTLLTIYEWDAAASDWASEKFYSDTYTYDGNGNLSSVYREAPEEDGMWTQTTTNIYDQQGRLSLIDIREDNRHSVETYFYMDDNTRNYSLNDTTFNEDGSYHVTVDMKDETLDDSGNITKTVYFTFDEWQGDNTEWYQNEEENMTYDASGRLLTSNYWHLDGDVVDMTREIVYTYADDTNMNYTAEQHDKYPANPENDRYYAVKSESSGENPYVNTYYYKYAPEEEWTISYRDAYYYSQGGSTANESIADSAEPTFEAYTADGSIVITTSEAQAVQVYGVTGVCHYNATVSGTATIANLPAGIYIVTAGGETLKVAVR